MSAVGVGHSEEGMVKQKFASLKDINTVLEYAKLESTDLKSEIQTIFFSHELDNDHIKLLELDTNVADALKQGDEVVIRGDKDELAVLCTKDRTFDIKDTETSNSLLILPSLKFDKELAMDGEQITAKKEVCSVLQKYYELRPIKPRLQKLKRLLEENMFSGVQWEDDEEHQGKKYTFSDLLDQVQASEMEIKQSLKKLQACEIDGYWRMLDFDFVTQVLNHVIQLCEENDWLDTGVPVHQCCTSLSELYEKNIVEHIIHCYADKKDLNDSSADLMETDEIFDLNEDKVCRFFAEITLRHAGKFNFKEFMASWQQCVPEGMKVSLSQIESDINCATKQLYFLGEDHLWVPIIMSTHHLVFSYTQYNCIAGMALTDRTSTLEVIWYFPVEDLPEDLDARFSKLFEVRPKWTLEEITPYIIDLTTEKLGVGALLTKYARCSFQNGIKTYNSKITIIS